MAMRFSVVAALIVMFSLLVSATPTPIIEIRQSETVELPPVPTSFSSIADINTYGSLLQVTAHSDCNSTANPTVCETCEVVATTTFAAALVVCGTTIAALPAAIVCGSAVALTYFNALQACLA